MTLPASNWKIGLPLAIVTAMCWGVMPLLLKGLLDQLDPMTLAWTRQVGCGAVMVAYFLWRRDVSWSALRSWRVIGLVAICALGMTGNALLFNIGLLHATPSATQVLGQLGPVLVLVGAVLLFKESFTRQQWFGAATAVVGLAVFFHDRVFDLLHQTSFGYGMLMLLIAPLFWSSYALAQKRLGLRLGSQQVLMISYVLGVFALLPFSQTGRVALLDTDSWTLLAAVIAVYVVSYVALGVAMSRWEASRVSAMITLTPLFTLGFGHLIAWIVPTYLGAENHDALSWGGALMVVVGSFLAAMPRRRYAQKA